MAGENDSSMIQMMDIWKKTRAGFSYTTAADTFFPHIPTTQKQQKYWGLQRHSCSILSLNVPIKSSTAAVAFTALLR